MRYVSINDAKPGMRLAYDLFDTQGRIIIGSNKALTEKLIERLDKFGFSGMYIDDEISEDIELLPIISPELRNAGMLCIKEKNIDKCIDIATGIVNEIMKSGALRGSMLDLRSYDDYTYAHSVNVAVLCCVVGMSMELATADLEALRTAALLHDLGKLDIEPDILYKTERLTPDEYQIMKGHVIRSYELVSGRSDLSSVVKNTILGHHENVDGTGYPQGLTGDEQTLPMKIIHVCDVYDALTTRRPYKNPYSPCEGMEYLMGACGRFFDIEVVRHFVECIPMFMKGTEVRLSNDRIGIVIENNGIHNGRPILRMLDTMEEIDLAKRENMAVTIISSDEVDCESPMIQEHGRKKMIAVNRRQSVLIVDPSEENQKELIEILSHRYDLITVNSGEAAITYLQENSRPDIIVMELGMDDKDGIETASIIKQNHIEVPDIIYTTSKCDITSVNKFLDVGAAGYLIRPYRPVFVKSEVERVINGWSEFG